MTINNAQMNGPGSTWGACGGFPTHTPVHSVQACRDRLPVAAGFRLRFLLTPQLAGVRPRPFIQFAGSRALVFDPFTRSQSVFDPFCRYGGREDRQPILIARRFPSSRLRMARSVQGTLPDPSRTRLLHTRNRVGRGGSAFAAAPASRHVFTTQTNKEE